jgi:[ribosomal protein S18]-alanine N-acetyltransferase
MRLTSREKDQDMFRRLLKISDDSFTGVERPPSHIFLTHFQEDDVFVDSALTPGAFAIVTQRGGPYIWSIAVQPSMRGQGVATALLKELAETYFESSIQLTCNVNNWVAQRVYLANGYRVVRVMPRYYGVDDGVLMRRMI